MPVVRHAPPTLRIASKTACPVDSQMGMAGRVVPNVFRKRECRRERFRARFASEKVVARRSDRVGASAPAVSIGSNGLGAMGMPIRTVPIAFPKVGRPRETAWAGATQIANAVRSRSGRCSQMRMPIGTAPIAGPAQNDSFRTVRDDSVGATGSIQPFDTAFAGRGPRCEPFGSAFAIGLGRVDPFAAVFASWVGR
jgi:hypothetical protein